MLFLVAGLFGHAADHLQPVAMPIRAGDATLGVIGGSLILIGLTIGISGIRGFSSARTPVPTNQPPRALVTNGIHGWSRNPIYLGMFLIYGGIGVAAHSVWILLLAVPLAITMRYGVVAREEAYLERRFGEAYRSYRARVRRWL
jgi:protein-S-isoprenylcysteine O-methyltransferase Ste14